MMASKSRLAQEKLLALEKDSKSFEEQIIEAAKFLEVDLDAIRTARDCYELNTQVVYHGREEWLFRWLLKKLQAPGNRTARSSSSSWWLLFHLIQAVPHPNAARMLTDKKFMTILQQTLDEVQNGIGAGYSETDNFQGELLSNSEDQNKQASTSKKRKRPGHVVTANKSQSMRSGQDLLRAISAAVERLVNSTRVFSGSLDDVRGIAFSAECMKSVIRTTAEEAARILGAWVSLSIAALKTSGGTELNLDSWLLPFVDIWKARTISDVEQMEFSLHCTQPILSLFQSLREIDSHVGAQTLPQLEELLARNVLLPAKVSKMENADSDLLSTLTRLPIIRDSANGPILFDTAIRLLPSYGARRRRPQDEFWLQAVFKTLREAMPPQRTKVNGKAICDMLRSAIVYKVDLGLAILRSVISELALPEGETDWELLATIIKLDANALLIPNADRDLLKDTLTRITTASLDPSWSEISTEVVSSVLLPLMEEFAKARDLSGYIRHWFTQLVEFEGLRKISGVPATGLFSAWEHEALQTKLVRIFEASLTVHQIEQILDWLSSEVEKNPDAVCVILEAIAASISWEEIVDTVGLRLYHIMFDNAAPERLDSRYRWRAWRILSRSLDWITATEIQQLPLLCKEKVSPFGGLDMVRFSERLSIVRSGKLSGMELLESVRFVCAAWTAAGSGSDLQATLRPVLHDVFMSLHLGLKWFVNDLQSGKDVGKDKCDPHFDSIDRGLGWVLWSYLRCLFVEYPKALDLGPDFPHDESKDVLQTLFLIASASESTETSEVKSLWLQQNSKAFRDLWMALLCEDQVRNHAATKGHLIDIMLSPEPSYFDSVVDVRWSDTFAVWSLLQLPFEFFTKKDRERVLSHWLSIESGSSKARRKGNNAKPAMLSLLVKMMKRPTSYEGMKFNDLVDLGSILSDLQPSEMRVVLALFKELTELTLTHMTTNCDQHRNRAYILDAVSHLKQEVSKKRPKQNDCSITIVFIEAVLVVLKTKSQILEGNGILTSSMLHDISTLFQHSLLLQIEVLRKDFDKGEKESKANDLEEVALMLNCTIDALSFLGIDGSMLAQLDPKSKSFLESVVTKYTTENELAQHLLMFLASNEHILDPRSPYAELSSDTSTVYGRSVLRKRVHALIVGKPQQERLKMLESMVSLETVDLKSLDKLLAIRYLVESCDDARSPKEHDEGENTFGLSTAYSALCAQLKEATSVRKFCIISEIMSVMLLTKGRALRQWNIDSTLGSIALICSRNGPTLRSNRSGTIYLHLCRLVQAVLISHRLKLQGHFHLVVQVMQTLLRCLFVPLPHTAAKINKIFAPPPWLSSPQHPLIDKHAAAYTRLVTLICDPSVSSVTRSQHNNLTSATDKAKRMAGQHMQFLLTTYIKLQLEMKMVPQVKERIVPGLYAVFDTTTPELRRAISDGLDASGRALFGVLFRDYQRFGKWKGS